MTEKILLTDEIIATDEPMLRFFDEAKKAATDLPPTAHFVETGTRSGHTSILLLRAIYESQKFRWLFTIDPYGEKPYGTGGIISKTFDYGEQHYRNAMYSLSKYAWEKSLAHYHFRMRSQDFDFFIKNVTFWHEASEVQHSYGFVYLDGEHTFDAVKTELDFFLPKLVKGGVIVIDDISFLGDRVKDLPIQGEVYHNKLFYQS